MKSAAFWSTLFGVVILLLMPVGSYAESPGPVIEPDGIVFPATESSRVLILLGPDGSRWDKTFGPGEAPMLTLQEDDGRALTDGMYRYELRWLDSSGPENQRAGKPNDSEAVPDVTADVDTGRILIEGGRFVLVNPTKIEDVNPDAVAADVHSDDVSIYGGLCVGSAWWCGNHGDQFHERAVTVLHPSPSLDFLALDASVFPSTLQGGWRIETDGPTYPGEDYFAIRRTRPISQTPFRIRHDAYTNTLVLGPLGLGVNTPNPTSDLHIRGKNAFGPRIRLEDDIGAPQLYEIAANSGGFTIFDSTANQTPLSFKPGAPGSSIFLDQDGDLGFGTQTPDSALHLRRANGSARIHVDEKSSTAGERTLAILSNKGATNLQFDNTDVNRQWSMGVRSGGNFRIQSQQAAPGVINFEMNLDGALTLSGNLTVGSCSGCVTARSVGESSAELLAKLSRVPLQRWSARHEDTATGTEVFAEHLMPNAQVFHELYELGLNGDGIAPLDVATVALAAAQALAEQDERHSAEIAALEARIAALEAVLGVQAPATPQATDRIFMPSARR